MASNSKLKLKLMIDMKSRKVLFAEAGKDVVDFLFSLLALPIGSIIKLITKESMAGCLGTMYSSLEQLDNTYLLSTQSKSQLLNPTTSTAASTNFLLRSVSTNAPVDKINKYYRCLVSGSIYQSEFHNYVTDAHGTACSTCQNPMIVQVQLIAKKEEKGKKGFVKGVVTYIVMDDLSVVPMSTVSSITSEQVLHQGPQHSRRENRQPRPSRGFKATKSFLAIKECGDGCFSDKEEEEGLNKT